MSEPLDVLAVAAHPDDAEVGCGGALLLAADAGLRTGVVDLTAGEASTRGTPDARARERDDASALLGLAVRECLGLPDGGVGTDPGHRLALVDALRRLRPRLLLAPHVQDRHPDHAAAGRLATEAIFLARVARVGSGPTHAASRLYHYLMHHRPPPAFVVDISAVWERKRAVIEAYDSQFGAGPGPATEISGGGFLRTIEARAVSDGATVGAAFGEPYVHTGPLGVPGLPDPGPPGDGPRPYSMGY
jgi:N-acetylglucosamine malate deacetylase 1